MNTLFEVDKNASLIFELEKDIPKYAKAYYEGQALVTDDVFDKMVDKLKELKPDSKILSTPGWGYIQIGAKVPHKYQVVKSLDKCKTYADIPDRFKQNLVCNLKSPKLDGLTGVAYYKEGKLIQAVTRGNGVEGKDITDKLNIIIGNTIADTSFTGAVRGELIISKLNWNSLKEKYPEYSNARNLCSGWIGSKEYNIEDIKLIDFVVYKINGQEINTFNSKQNIINWLHNNFKHSIPSEVINLYNIDTTIFESFMRDIFDRLREEYIYEVDGIVISKDEVIYDTNNAYIYDEVAYKFQSETAETIIKDIKWEMSRTQRYIPIIEIEPVFLSGANIQNVTGNNAQFLIDNGLGIGATIEIMRSGEVIPKIIDTINPVDPILPINCPHCHNSLKWSGVDLKCDFEKCCNIYYSDLQQWCEMIGETDGLAWTLMKQYLDVYNINSISDLYENKEFILNNLRSKQLSITEQKILSFFIKLYEDDINIEKALIALNIPRLGDKTVKLLIKNKDLIDNIILFIVNDYEVESDLGSEIYNKLLLLVKEATTQSICNNISKLKNLKYIFNRLVYPEIKKTALNAKYVAITGSLNSMKRDAFIKYIEQFGYEMISNLKKADYLITNNPDSGSSKNKDAQKYGVKILTEAEFLELLK